MAKSAEEKEKSFVEAIGKCTSLEKLLKMNVTDASESVVTAFDAKKKELEAAASAKSAEEEAQLVPVQKDGETIRVHSSQVEQHRKLGWFEVKD